ncbi:hypothetical protein EDB81DRAFT_311128 [Dactylonectria macrodidyma]|uniref:Uncharacterized protein n=1 Tax=Dactylonectria macrodidyma TaxID=307937 RepID=A0A9P9IAZ8_9HYPO|nr:hypothetical protein EDB81DRAFT_311128 [Dactylonectria macrodidyma]
MDVHALPPGSSLERTKKFLQFGLDLIRSSSNGSGAKGHPKSFPFGNQRRFEEMCQTYLFSTYGKFGEMMSDNSRLPCVSLSALYQSSPMRNSLTYENNPQLHLSICLIDDNAEVDSLSEWLRLMLEGIKDAKVESSFRATFR